jgi:2'-5' RNA ligase
MIVLTDEVGSCKKKSSYPFSSVQVNLPKIATKRIIHWGEENIPDEDIYEEPDNLVRGREYESHVTIAYGINNDTPKKIKRLLARQKPFYIEFGKISIFKCINFDVVKIEIESPDLRRINKAILDGVEVTTTSCNAYRPHVTIAFVKKNKGDKFNGNADFAGNRLLVDRLTFSSKNGVQTTIELKDESK